jgi:hypothetical protein
MLISLFNAKNPNGKRVPVTVNLESFPDKENFGLPDQGIAGAGDIKYVMVLQTGVLDIHSKAIDPIYVEGVTQATLKDELQKALTTLAEKINWGLLEEDMAPPVIDSLSISNNDTNVSMESDLFITLKDPLPSSLIDPSTIKLEVNGIDVSDKLQIVEKGNTVNIHWIPIRIYP